MKKEKERKKERNIKETKERKKESERGRKKITIKEKYKKTQT